MSLCKNKIKRTIKKGIDFLLKKSLESAAREQRLCELRKKIEEIVPDITDQYSLFKIDNPYLEISVRNLHAFQISLVNAIIREFQKPVIVDIGDSAGTHLQYIIGLNPENKSIDCLSVNIDQKAVGKIKSKGLMGICSRAEDLQKYNINADMLLCFEMLEHLMNPCYFLHELSSKTNAQYLIITVPYLKKSRIGLHHIRNVGENKVFAENTHIFELCPADWKLLVQHSGWKILHEKIYLQYPKYGLLRITQPLWKRFDFEGFYGLILKRDDTWSSKYLDW